MKPVSFSIRLTTTYAAGVIVTVLLSLASYHILTNAGNDWASNESRYLELLGRIVIVAVGVSLLLGHLIGRGISRRIVDLAAGAQRVVAGNLETRIPVRGHDELTQLAVTFNEMTSRLQDSLARQGKLEQARRDLVANVAHDLRTPLAAIQAAAEALEEGVVEDKTTATHYVSVVGRETRYLGRLIDDLFMLSQLEADQFELEPESVYLENILQECLVGLLPQLERQDISLSVDMPAMLPPLWADRHATRRVLTNLLQNALAFTPPGGQITVQGVPVDDQVQVEVIDTGPGIPAEDLAPGPDGQPRIFERFYRVDDARAGGGAGLGLTIARGLVQTQGGQIWAKSIMGEGTTIGFTLPRSKYTDS